MEVIRDIAPRDKMYEHAPHWYYKAGPAALACIELALQAAQAERPGRVLDFACGYGRVLRTLKAAFPDAELTACDTNPKAIEFCSRVFGAKAVQSKLNPDQIDFGGTFDLIWCGSLLTHVDEQAWAGLLDMFQSALSPGGVVVFTTHGRLIVERRLRPGFHPLSFDQEQRTQVLRDYDRTGFGFNPSVQPELDWGDCVSSPAWVLTQLQRTSLRLVLYTEAGWGERPDEWAQDVVAATAPAE